MALLENLLPAIVKLLPLLATLAILAAALWAVDWWLLRRRPDVSGERLFARQIVMLVLTAVGIVFVVIALPVDATLRGQLLALLGLVLTAVIGLASTTFVANIMAGLMLRSVASFRPGDYVRVGDHFGRVTERGLFHTEIQTEDRDLTTLPNLYLATTPTTVVRSSGTIISCSLSLGYDVAHGRVQPLLVEAASVAELQEPFVQVMELGDFSVTYRVAGFLPEPKHLLTARSRLRTAILDTLHGAAVEILSPSYMAQRPVPPDVPVIPRPEPPAPGPVEEDAPESRIFDKAEHAGLVEALRSEAAELTEKIKALEAQLAQADKDARPPIEVALSAHRAQLDTLTQRIEEAAGEAQD